MTHLKIKICWGLLDSFLMSEDSIMDPCSEIREEFH